MRIIFCYIFGAIIICLCNAQGKNKDTAKPIEKSDIEIEYLRVVSTIQARFATTLISSFVANRAEKANEITFTAQLPDAAFISNFSMQIDDKIIYGNVEEKEEAKAHFEAAKARGQSTGLVAKAPRETNSFTISVNVAAQSKIRFNLTYQEVLKRVHGVYKHIINLQPDHPVSDLKCDIYITEKGEITNVKVPKFAERMGEKTNKELLTLEDESNVQIKPVTKQENTSSIHIRYHPKNKVKSEVYNGQLVVLYDVKRDQNAGDIEVVNGYFVHFFAPEGLQRRPKNIVFVLDKSGSMTGRKISQLRDAMKVILKDLTPEDVFQILFFESELEFWRKEPSQATPENIQAASEYVRRTEANGGTNIYDSMQKALKILKASHSNNSVPMILFLTDGEATSGITDSNRIINDVTNSNNQENKVIIHSIAFGADSDYSILQKISGRNRGVARRVYEDSDASIQLAGFYEEISSPVLTDLKINYLNETVDVSSIVSDTTHNYYNGSEVIVVGKVKDTNQTLDQQIDIGAKVTGQSATGPVIRLAHSEPRIFCAQPRSTFAFADVDEQIGGNSNITSPSGATAGENQGMERRIPHEPIRCCPPPHCCWWHWCPTPHPPLLPPPPTQAPKELLPASSAGGFLERMWAYETIKKLLVDVKEKPNDKELKKKALELSLKYHFVTELTSMVVVKPNDAQSSSLEEQKENRRAEPASSSSFSSSSFSGVHGVGGRIAGGGVALHSFPQNASVGLELSARGGRSFGGAGFGAFGPPRPAPAQAPAPVAPEKPQNQRQPSGTRINSDEEKDENQDGEILATAAPILARTSSKRGHKILATATPSLARTSSKPASNFEVVFVISDDKSLNSVQKDFVSATINKLRNLASTTAKVGVVIASDDGHGYVSQPLATLDDVPASLGASSNSNANSSLITLVDSLFGQYAKPGIKRHIVFLPAGFPQYVQDVTHSVEGHGVNVAAEVRFKQEQDGPHTSGDPSDLARSLTGLGYDFGDTRIRGFP